MVNSLSRHLFSLVFTPILFLLPLSHAQTNSNNGDFRIVNGQIYTPGLVIVDSPQPFTPMGGDFLQIALAIDGNGRLPQPPNNNDSLTQIHSVAVFLTSYSTGKNFTISNITTSATPPLGPILSQEPGSTVKHVNWEWPNCLVGNGRPKTGDTTTARGDYNITIHEKFRLNGTEFYTVFALPIAVTNEIKSDPGSSQILTNPVPGPVNTNGGRMNCASIENELLADNVVKASVKVPDTQPYLGGGISLGGGSSSKNSGSSGDTSDGLIGAALGRAIPDILHQLLIFFIMAGSMTLL